MNAPATVEYLQVCAVDYGVDPDGPHVRVLDTMSVPGLAASVLRSARGLRDMRQANRENEYVFLRRAIISTRYERIGS